MGVKKLNGNLNLILLSLFVLAHACGKREKQVEVFQKGGSVCAILAHPDDETIISGTLAMLSAWGVETSVIYVTSGDDGPDETGRNLKGLELAQVREAEAAEALVNIGVVRPPVFLRFPDGHVHQYVHTMRKEKFIIAAYPEK